MGKNKPNGYQLFVNEKHRKMCREDSKNAPAYQALFRTLDSEWRGLPEEVRQRYKDRAKNGDSRGFNSSFGSSGAGFSGTSGSQEGRPYVSNRDWSSGPPRPNASTTEPTPGPSSATNNGVKVNSSPTKADIKFFDVKPDIESKPTIKEERGVKRPLELEVYQGPQNRNDHDDGERPSKKQKPGYGVPNWRNIKNSLQPDADRYFDYHLLELRNTCESIVSTRERRLITMPLYSFSCNVLCKYKKDGKDTAFIPIEMGIHAFSIEKGTLGKPYHVIINAGPPPRNYFNDSNDHALKTHKIKFTQSGIYPPEARNDYRTIYKEMLKYTRGGERTILVADVRDLDQVKLSIQWIYDKASEFDKTLAKPSTWTILPLVEFIASAYNFVYVRMLHYPIPKFTLHYFLKVRLEASLWDYETDLMCPYHQKEENQTKWCARSCAIRAINCIQTTIEEIYEHYKEATEPPPQPEETGTSTGEANDEPGPSQVPSPATTSQQASRPTPVSARPTVQQMQQPLYFVK